MSGQSKLPPAKRMLVYSGGKFNKKSVLNYPAILIKHDEEYVLFDTGFGKQIKTQFQRDMPFWLKPIFKYKPLRPAVEQISPEIVSKIQRIFLSHVHWDHASGIVDFPSACIATSQTELDEVIHRSSPVVFESQVSSNLIHWCPYDWSQKEVLGIPESFDIFGDGSAIVVSLPGHTAGSVGLLIQTKDKRYFFTGDTTWSLAAAKKDRTRFIVSSTIVDSNRVDAKKSVHTLNVIMAQNPNLVIVPSHDSIVQDSIGYYPNWVQ